MIFYLATRRDKSDKWRDKTPRNLKNIMPAPKNIMPPDKGIMAARPVTNCNKLVPFCHQLNSAGSISWPREIDARQLWQGHKCPYLAQVASKLDLVYFPVYFRCFSSVLSLFCTCSALAHRLARRSVQVASKLRPVVKYFLTTPHAQPQNTVIQS